MISGASIPSPAAVPGKAEVVVRTEAVSKPETSAETPALARRGRKPGSVVTKKKPSAGQRSTYYFQVEKGYTPGAGKPPVVVKDFKDEDEAYRECFKVGSLCIRGEIFSVDIVGKTLTEIPVQTATQPE